MLAAHPKIDIVTSLAQLPLFHALTAEQLAILAAGTREKRLQKGELLFQKGDKPKGFYMVLKGQIKLALSTAQGNEKIVHVIHPLQSFGEAVMFMERNYPVFAVALADSILLHIGQTEIFDLLLSDPQLARRMLAGLSMRLHGLLQDVEVMTLHSSTARIIGYLLRSLGNEPLQGSLDLELPISKQVLASLLHLTPETLSRVFHDLSAHGLIIASGKRVHIPDVAKLARYQA